MSGEQIGKLLNDISEGIDCGESRDVLRQALMDVSTQLTVTRSEVNELQSRFSLFQCAKKLMDSALNQSDEDSPYPRS